MQPAITTITRKAIPAAATAEAMRKRRAPAAVPAEPAAADAVHRLRLWKVRMSEKPAVPTTEEPSTAVAEMEVGEKVNIHLMPEEAYGMPDPNAIFTVAIAQLPGAEEVEVGQQVYLQNQYGQPFPVKVTAKDETNITFDANHEMAGKELNFEIELVEVK